MVTSVILTIRLLIQRNIPDIPSIFNQQHIDLLRVANYHYKRQKVSGSIPLISATICPKTVALQRFSTRFEHGIRRRWRISDHFGIKVKKVQYIPAP